MPRNFTAVGILFLATLWLPILDAEAQNPAAPAPNEDMFTRRSREDQAELTRLETLHAPTGDIGRRVTEIREGLARANTGDGANSEAYLRTQTDFAAYLELVARYQELLNQSLAAREAEPRDYTSVNAFCATHRDTDGPQRRNLINSRLTEVRNNTWAGLPDPRARDAIVTLFRHSLNLINQMNIRCQNVQAEQAVIAGNQVIREFNQQPADGSAGVSPTLGEIACARDPYLRTLPRDVCMRRFTEGGLLQENHPQRGGVRPFGAPPVSAIESNPPPRVNSSPIAEPKPDSSPVAPAPGSVPVQGGPRPGQQRPGG